MGRGMGLFYSGEPGKRQGLAKPRQLADGKEAPFVLGLKLDALLRHPPSA